MGVDVSGYTRYGYVFSRDVIEEKLRSKRRKEEKGEKDKDGYDSDEELEALFSEESGIEVDSSVDRYSGDDYAEEIYVFLNDYGVRLGCKGGDCTIEERKAFIVPDEAIEKLDSALKKLDLLGKHKSVGWICRTYLS